MSVCVCVWVCVFKHMHEMTVYSHMYTCYVSEHHIKAWPINCLQRFRGDDVSKSYIRCVAFHIKVSASNGFQGFPEEDPDEFIILKGCLASVTMLLFPLALKNN